MTLFPPIAYDLIALIAVASFISWVIVALFPMIIDAFAGIGDVFN